MLRSGEEAMKFTCTNHGDRVNSLVAYWRDQNKREIEAGSWFMSALTLGSGLEALLYAYIIVWSGDDDPVKDAEIASDLDLGKLIEAAKHFDLLSSAQFKDEFGCHTIEDVIDEIRKTRNNLHPGVALRNNFNPAQYTKEQYTRLAKIFDSVLDSIERNL
jgi:hypothetical protein